MFTITVHGTRASGAPSGRSSTARRWFSNWLVTAPSWVQWPVLCGRIASSLTSTRPSRGLEQLDREHAGDAELARDRHRDLLGLDGERRVEVGRGGDHLVADAVALGRGDDRPRRPPVPTASGPPARTARAGSRPAPRPGSSLPESKAAAQSSGPSTNQTPLPSYPPRVVFRTQGSPNASTPPRPRRPARCAGRARRARRAAAASRPCPGRARAPPARAVRRASASSACRWSVGTCSWSKVTTSHPSVTSRRVSRSV